MHAAVMDRFQELETHARATVPELRSYPGALADQYCDMWGRYHLHDFTASGALSSMDIEARYLLRTVPELDLLNGLLGLAVDVTSPVRAVPDGDHWRVAGDGEKARNVTALPVWRHLTKGGRSMSCIDVVAVDGPRWRTMGGYATMLGRWDAADEEVFVRATPKEWIEAGGTRSGGVCILDHGSQDAMDLLLFGPRLRTTKAHASKLLEWQAKLRPGIPRIVT